ncbi:DUF1648 domain-containing protein [Halosimplex salinum]|uniref:DUF1648 domain-containing protein n=1 Tax=Halosimplex salinum TaxID=1710538 RepID=UPI000F47EDB8|nr:DUF1648 domain-containing protein [Halosimplex salinum]
MALPSTRLDWLSYGIIAATLLAGVALWGRLPAEMAIHFSASGTPDNFVPRWAAVGSMPALMVVTLLFVDAAARFDPPKDPRVIDVVKVATAGLLAAVQGFILAWNLGYEVPFDLLMAGVLLWTVAVVGYAVARERGASPF